MCWVLPSLLLLLLSMLQRHPAVPLRRAPRRRGAVAAARQTRMGQTASRLPGTVYEASPFSIVMGVSYVRTVVLVDCDSHGHRTASVVGARRVSSVALAFRSTTASRTAGLLQCSALRKA